MNMRKILLLVFCISFVFYSNAQLSITDANTNFTIDFDSTVSGVINGQYDGTDIVHLHLRLQIIPGLQSRDLKLIMKSGF